MVEIDGGEMQKAFGEVGRSPEAAKQYESAEGTGKSREMIEQIHEIVLAPNLAPKYKVQRVHELCDEALGHNKEYHERLRHR